MKKVIYIYIYILSNGCRSLPLQVLPLLERFEKIILWMDSDEPGKEGAEKFAKKLGVNRTYIVHCLEAKDANDALLMGDIDMQACVDEAELLPHDRIVTFRDLRKDVLKELLEPDLYSGTAIPSLPRFTQLIKGFRRGEIKATNPSRCKSNPLLSKSNITRIRGYITMVPSNVELVCLYLYPLLS